MDNNFAASILLPIAQINSEFKAFFFDVISQSYPSLIPVKYGCYEPLGNVFSGKDISKIIEFDWQDLFCWKAKDKTVEALWSVDKRLRYSCLLVYGKQNHFKYKEIFSVLSYMIKAKGLISGHIHMLGLNECYANKNFANKVFNPLNVGFTIHDLKVAIPNLPWGLFLGQKYIDLIGLEKILSCPAYLVRQIENGIYLQVTENINDTVNDYPAFEAKRAEIKKHLGERYFFNPAFYKSDYITPDFGI